MLRPKRTEVGYRSIADVFAGFAVAVLMVLVVLWLQAMADAYKIRKLKRIKRIVDDAFLPLVAAGDQDIVIDKKLGIITVKAEKAFATGEWLFLPQKPVLQTFERTRSKLAGVLDRIEASFGEIDDLELDPRDYVEILIVGHTDCVAFQPRRRSKKHQRVELQDNWDLSVLRAAAIGRFLTEPCPADVAPHGQAGNEGLRGAGAAQFSCCEAGDASCADRRVDPRWKVLPAGRSYFEPRTLPAGLDPVSTCDKASVSKEWLAQQRRVVIQLVPRIDKIMVRLD